FEAERQALAMMDHPNVAKVLDAGMTESGRPYFAMEHVAGVPITDYADAARLSTKARVELFITVCQAVHHAHQKGIIHRDLKPSNILVALFDGKPVAKVIDFGVAKAIHTPLTDRTLHTEAGRLVGTPEYISPEQAQSGGLDIDTRTDIYSLGVILYELLTGTLPFDSTKLRGAGHEAMVKMIREVEPPKPSTRITTLMSEPRGLAKTPTGELGRRRGSELKNVASEVRGELDWIVLKAIDKDRTRRYASASDVAADLTRYLNHEAVLAGAPSATYKVGKFVRRYRLPVIAGLVVLGVLVVSLGVIAALLREAVAARDLARGARTEAEQTNALMLEVIGASDLVTNPRARDRTLVSVLDDFVRKMDSPDSQLTPLQTAKMRVSISSAYRSHGRILDSLRLAEKNLTVVRATMPEDKESLARAMLALAWSQYASEPRDAWKMAEPAYEILSSIGGVQPMKSARLIAGHVAPTLEQRRRYYNEGLEEAVRSGKEADRRLFGLSLALVDYQQAKYAESEALSRKYLFAGGPVSGQPGSEPLAQEDTNSSINLRNLALSIDSQGRFEEGLRYHERAVAINARLLPKEHPHVVIGLSEMRWPLKEIKSMGRLEQVDAELERVLTELLAGNADFADEKATGLAKDWSNEWQIERSVRMFRAVVERRLRTNGPDHEWTAGSRGDLAERLILLGLHQEALANIDLARPVFEAKGNAGALMWLDRTRFDALVGAGRMNDARQLLAQLQQQRLASSPAEDVKRWGINDEALIMLAEKRFAEAEPQIRALIASYPTEKYEAGIAEATSMLGEALAAQGHYSEAVPLLRQGAEACTKLSELPYRKLQSVQRCIAAGKAEGKLDQAAAWKAWFEERMRGGEVPMP
ncbi:MAG: protein kinase, partial [Phycisphaerales bacterium]|nr:protein kinase [Phycisphaerales bacterium]